MNDRKRNTVKNSKGMPPVALASFLTIATVVLCLVIAIVVEEDDSIQTCNFENGPFEFKVVSDQEVEIVKYNGCEQTA